MRFPVFFEVENPWKTLINPVAFANKHAVLPNIPFQIIFVLLWLLLFWATGGEKRWKGARSRQFRKHLRPVASFDWRHGWRLSGSAIKWSQRYFGWWLFIFRSIPVLLSRGIRPSPAVCSRPFAQGLIQLLIAAFMWSPVGVSASLYFLFVFLFESAVFSFSN